MGEIAEVVGEVVEKVRESRLNTIVAITVSVTATVMALCSVKDGNINQAMQQAQTKAVDAWSFYQAKSTKQHLAEATVDQLETLRETAGATLTPEARALVDRKVTDHRARARQYEAEKADIKAQAEGYEKQYDALNFHDDQFDMAEAALSVALAVAGVTALTQKRWLLVVVGAFVAFGVTMGVAGFLGSGLHPDILARLLS
jgi:hypothetical protein